MNRKFLFGLTAALSLSLSLAARAADAPADAGAPAVPAKPAAAKSADKAKADKKAEKKADAKAEKKAEAKATADASDKDSAVPAHQKHPLDTDYPAPKGTRVELSIGSETAIAYSAKPAGEPKGLVLVIHEYWGLNDWIKHEADELAGQGYLALAVDLYKGKVATTPDEAGKLMGGMDKEWAAKVEHAGIQWLKGTAPQHNLGVIGWCMGGGQALQASLSDASDVSATVIYYGMPVMDVKTLSRLKGGAVLGQFAKKDGWITPDKVDAFDQALTQAGVQHSIISYDADHAFANPSGGKHNPEAAKEAWKQTKTFLADHLN